MASHVLFGIVTHYTPMHKGAAVLGRTFVDELLVTHPMVCLLLSADQHVDQAVAVRKEHRNAHENHGNHRHQLDEDVE